ncbi:MAG: A24 family peptidase [Acidobacteriota bacterium]|nr:A24 family peptidase [Acidobacteriota bacterium]
MTQPPHSAAALLACLAIVAGIWDLRTRRIPNWLTLSGVIAGLAIHTFLFGLSGLWHSCSGMLLAFSVYLALYLLRAMGAGDVKLMAAVGSLVGPANWFAIFLLSATVGGLAAFGLILRRKRVRKTFGNAAFIIGEMMRMRPAYLEREELDVNSSSAVTLPHGTVIAVACALFLFWSSRGVF